MSNATDPYTIQGSRQIHRLNTRCKNEKKWIQDALGDQRFVYISTTTTGNTYIVENNSIAVYWSGYVSPIENYILSNYRYLFRTAFSSTFLLPDNDLQEEGKDSFGDGMDIGYDSIELAISMLQY